MPIWFQSATDANRSSFNVTLTYWTYGRNAEFALIDGSGVTLRKVYGESCWHPATRPRMSAKGSLSWAGVSEYTIVKVGDLVDVVDHNSRPAIFRMTDDERIIREARESIARGECRDTPDTNITATE